MIIYYDYHQQKITQTLIDERGQIGYDITIKMLPVTPFWRAEAYHQDYHTKNGLDYDGH